MHRTLEALRDAAARCHGCPLYKEATHVVFGEGPADARAVFVGEVPGDYEGGTPSVIRSSDPPAACSTRRSPPPGSIASACS